MSTQRAQEILYESEATLRLVDNELSRLRTADREALSVGVETEHLSLMGIASEQLRAIIVQIRRSRSLSEHRLRAYVAAEADASEKTLVEIEERLAAVTRLFESSLRAETARSEYPRNA